MVISKKCKICTALYDDNIGICGTYFDKSLPLLIENISGVQLDPRKANGVLICKLCTIQLVHAEMIIDKLRNTLQRLKKPVKEMKPKTPYKDIGANTNVDGTKIKPKSTVARRKSVIMDDSFAHNKENGELTMSSEFDFKKHSAESKKVVGRKTECHDIEVDQSNEIEKFDLNLVLKQILDKGAAAKKFDMNEISKEVELNSKTPKKIIKRKSVVPEVSITDKNGFQQNSEIKTTVFKKIADDKLTTTVNSMQSKPAKRKQISKVEDETGSNNLSTSDILEHTPFKHKKSSSSLEFEESTRNIDEQVISGSNNQNSLAGMDMLNCVICGKGFSKKTSLREHIESNHMGEKLKQCPNCSMEFRSQQKYETHVFSEKCKNSKLACQYPKCNRRFKTVHKMELHMNEKHSSSRQESEVD